MDIIQEETFGPVLPVVEFTDVEDAITWANDCEYGLTSSVYTQNLDMAFKLMRSVKLISIVKTLKPCRVSMPVGVNRVLVVLTVSMAWKNTFRLMSFIWRRRVN